MKRRASGTGFTITEVVVLTVVFALVATCLVVSLARVRQADRLTKEQAQLRGILQGLFVSATGGPDRYLLPSWFDKANRTVPAEGSAKDTTANIFSMLIYQGLVPVEIFVSPAESNPNIRIMRGYQMDRPAGTVEAEHALWDPAFSADFTSPEGGNVSYAHLPAQGERLKRWSNTFNSTEAVIGNRGPEIASVSYDEKGGPSPTLVNPKSNTLLIHGSKTKWEGQVGYNDNHVDFALQPWVEGASYTGTDGTQRGDVLFYDEPDDAGRGSNTLLGIFIKAGAERKDFRAIWD